MDGLTVSNADLMINSGQTTKEINRLRTEPTSSPATGIEKSGEKSFAATLQDAIGSVNQVQKEADVKMQELATGKTQNIHETMIAAEKADIALRMMVQVRNKVIEAYQEIMRMQV